MGCVTARTMGFEFTCAARCIAACLAASRCRAASSAWAFCVALANACDAAALACAADWFADAAEPRAWVAAVAAATALCRDQAYDEFAFAAC